MRTILAKQSQSQSLHTLGSAHVLLADTHEGELVEALTAQKLVNRCVHKLTASMAQVNMFIRFARSADNSKPN